MSKIYLELLDKTRQDVFYQLRVFGEKSYEVNTGDQITFPVSEDVEVTFLYYWYPAIRPLVATDSLPLASVEDIIADKAHTLGRRALWRDYVDLFTAIKDRRVSMEQIIALATKKFGGEFVKEQFLEQLSYFDDVAVVPIELTKQSHQPDEIKNFLTTQV